MTNIMDCTFSRLQVFRQALFAAAFLWTGTPGVVARFTPYAKAVSLDTVPSLVFQKWKLTNYRRNEPIYQLKCVSGCEFEPDWVKCFNVNSPVDKGPAWRCQADLPSHLQFFTLEVICEGYESKNDKSILEGSCGLEYSLRHVAPPNPEPRGAKMASAEVSNPEGKSELQWGTCQWLILATVIYVCCYCLYQVVQTDLKEALISTHQKTTELSTTGRCGKCQSARASLSDTLKQRYHSDLQSWQFETPSECRKPNEQATSPHLRATSPTCNSRLRSSPPRTPRSPRGGFFKKLDRPSRCRKREEFDSPKA
ncbi:store-operated calcium entry-associated regulatory factor [Marchantia polymorpha subsp. ruderalis]|uniref:Store-operated calcium entry-associated regulatory factor n=2 Tax=Marchantia polymorpha TaxID=3197 RepID=A0AAF6B518_MARPO|nr:hypothetical protein MARPO_0066s0040 [Marchantia polymorpha]BBN07102.1 hypothetical protein Mp_4g01030 [Marchantia polymorpha subsp. ruderalis]|eukprot:PTQ36082.1 hypothetical protein MARPO_0066s0040 [Marchantia polymorpha]